MVTDGVVGRGRPGLAAVRDLTAGAPVHLAGPDGVPAHHRRRLTRAQAARPSSSIVPPNTRPLASRVTVV